MPGVSAISDWKLRPFSGMLATNCWSTTVLTAAESVCNPKSRRTVTVSDVGPMREGEILVDRILHIQLQAGLHHGAKAFLLNG